jgi:hypothetical protein
MEKNYQSSPHGALRESIGTKIDTSLVPYELIVLAACGMNHGAEKYAPNNYRAGFKLTQLLGSIERHNRAMMVGEVIDGRSGLPHVALLASSVAMLCENWMNGTVIDDVAHVGREDSTANIAVRAEHISKHAEFLRGDGGVGRDAVVLGRR